MKFELCIEYRKRPMGTIAQLDHTSNAQEAFFLSVFVTTPHGLMHAATQRLSHDMGGPGRRKKWGLAFLQFGGARLFLHPHLVA
jgi:hypothetical protein